MPFPRTKGKTMTDKKISPESTQDADITKRRLLLRGGAVAGGC